MFFKTARNVGQNNENKFAVTATVCLQCLIDHGQTIQGLRIHFIV